MQNKKKKEDIQIVMLPSLLSKYIDPLVDHLYPLSLRICIIIRLTTYTYSGRTQYYAHVLHDTALNLVLTQVLLILYHKKSMYDPAPYCD